MRTFSQTTLTIRTDKNRQTIAVTLRLAARVNKYTTAVVDDNSLDIRLDNITGVDGGLYRCVYGGTGTLY